MRRITATVFLTLDGVMQAPGGPEEDQEGGFAHGGWSVPHWTDAMMAEINRRFAEPLELLLGRRTYEIFAAHWPHAGDDVLALKINTVTKYVATSRPEGLDWQNSVSLGEDAACALKPVLASEGPDLLLQGSSVLAQTLLAQDMIDELSLWTFPVSTGSGKRFFGSGAMPASFRLVEVSRSESGVLMTTYRRAGEIVTGSFAIDPPSAAELARRQVHAAGG
ncbi:dihydrofolate reductase family protein [Stappia sp.]|uniref:dihydrofolate reductase family protein n=1 Tax=Stappia sp. TaxID=1870903 RepID=UPI003D0D5E68